MKTGAAARGCMSTRATAVLGLQANRECYKKKTCLNCEAHQEAPPLPTYRFRCEHLYN
jgi:hypothetical protein